MGLYNTTVRKMLYETHIYRLETDWIVLLPGERCVESPLQSKTQRHCVQDNNS
jgi:hypothetical protein